MCFQSMQTFLGCFISSLLFVPSAPREAAAYLIPSPEKIHCTFCLACAVLNYLSILPLAEKKKTKKPASQPCPKSPGKDIHQHRPASPLGCLSVLVPLIKPHRFLFIKIMPRKPGILPKVRVQQNAKEELRHTGRKHSKSVQIRLPIFIQKTPKCKGVDQSFK